VLAYVYIHLPDHRPRLSIGQFCPHQLNRRIVPLGKIYASSPNRSNLQLEELCAPLLMNVVSKFLIFYLRFEYSLYDLAYKPLLLVKWVFYRTMNIGEGENYPKSGELTTIRE
jgi:hypothetical protein